MTLDRYTCLETVRRLDDYLDLTLPQIADTMGVPIGTVRSRLHRGRHMLQKQLWRVAEELGIVRSPSVAGER